MRRKLDIIQILRAFACIAILLYHLPSDNLFKANNSGFVLSVFFIISGYFLIAGNQNYYFSKKIIRIVPEYWTLTILLYFLQATKPGIVSNHPFTGEMLIKSMLFIPYFSDGVNIFPILPVGWTLIIEVFVYILFWMCLRVAERIGGKTNKKKWIALSCFLGSVVVLHFVSRMFTSNPYAVICGSNYLFAFVIGMILFMFYGDGKYKIECKDAVAIKASLIFIIGCIFILFAYKVEAFPVIFAGVFMAIVFLFRDLQLPSWSTFLGDISFSLYLSHKFVVPVVQKIANKLLNLGFITNSIIVLLGSVTISVFCAYVLYLIFEQRISPRLVKKFCK